MNWYWWFGVGFGVVIVIFVGLPVVAMFCPQFMTAVTVFKWNRWHKRMKYDPNYEEIKDEDGNHLEFRRKRDLADRSSAITPPEGKR